MANTISLNALVGAGNHISHHFLLESPKGILDKARESNAKEYLKIIDEKKLEDLMSRDAKLGYFHVVTETKYDILTNRINETYSFNRHLFWSYKDNDYGYTPYEMRHGLMGLEFPRCCYLDTGVKADSLIEVCRQGNFSQKDYLHEFDRCVKELENLFIKIMNSESYRKYSQQYRAKYHATTDLLNRKFLRNFLKSLKSGFNEKEEGKVQNWFVMPEEIILPEFNLKIELIETIFERHSFGWYFGNHRLKQVQVLPDTFVNEIKKWFLDFYEWAKKL